MKVTLEQWRALVAVVERGGYAQAAESLHKSQSAISYAIGKLERTVGSKLFVVEGRRAVLTSFGDVVLQRARQLIAEAERLERFASRHAQGWEPEVTLAVEMICPMPELFSCLDSFARNGGETTRLQVYETVMGGSVEALAERRVDIAITPHVPEGFSSVLLQRVPFVLVVSAHHPLRHADKPFTLRELRLHRHILTRDSGSQTDNPPVTIQSELRWTFGHISTSIRAIAEGHGYAWLPQPLVANELEEGSLVRLELEEQRELEVPLYMVIADHQNAGEAVKAMAAQIRNHFTQLAQAGM